MAVALPGQAESSWAVGARADAMATVRADTDAVLAWAGEDLWQQLEALLPFLPPQVSPVPGGGAAGSVAVGSLRQQRYWIQLGWSHEIADASWPLAGWEHQHVGLRKTQLLAGAPTSRSYTQMLACSCEAAGAGDV